MRKSLLIANRGEIAIRIALAAAELGMRTVAIYSEDDARSLHVARADKAAPLKGAGAGAYLDLTQIIALARAEGCDAVHPGYGFLSENAAFARACLEAGLTFVGPAPQTLDLFGDKSAARRLAERCGVSVSRGTQSPTTLEEARAFLSGLGPGAAVMVKATGGGGGRGLRVAASAGELEGIFERCRVGGDGGVR